MSSTRAVWGLKALRCAVRPAGTCFSTRGFRRRSATRCGYGGSPQAKCSTSPMSTTFRSAILERRFQRGDLLSRSGQHWAALADLPSYAPYFHVAEEMGPVRAPVQAPRSLPARGQTSELEAVVGLDFRAARPERDPNHARRQRDAAARRGGGGPDRRAARCREVSARRAAPSAPPYRRRRRRRSLVDRGWRPNTSKPRAPRRPKSTRWAIRAGGARPRRIHVWRREVGAAPGRARSPRRGRPPHDTAPVEPVVDDLWGSPPAPRPRQSLGAIAIAAAIVLSTCLVLWFALPNFRSAVLSILARDSQPAETVGRGGAACSGRRSAR
jgi:hypothetical protein